MPQYTLISHHLCPFVQRAAIMLLEKGILFQSVSVDLQNKPDWFLAMSPTGKVPLLQLEDSKGSATVLFESVAICEFLEDMHPQPALHPANAVTKARHRGWVEFGTATLADAWGFLNAQEPHVAQAKSVALIAKLAQFERELSDGPYFSGEQLCMVDITMAPVFRYFDALNAASVQQIFAGFERVAAWRQALAKRPSVQAAVAANYAASFRYHLQQAEALLMQEQ